MSVPVGVFAQWATKAWPIRYHCELQMRTSIVGGVPHNPKTVEGWIRSKVNDTEEILQQMILTTQAETGVSAEEAEKIVGDLRTLVGFKRDEQGVYIEGRQVKAAIKEAASIAAATGKIPSGKKYGLTNKGLLSFVAEHVMVVEDRIHLGQPEADEILTRPVHTHRGDSLSQKEAVNDAKISFNVWTDWDFEKDGNDDKPWWPMVWLTGQEQGLGADRSQGFGRYVATSWDRIK